MRIETTILKNLLHDEQFSRKTIPFLKEEYFNSSSEKIVYNHIVEFIAKYSSQPTREALSIEIDSRTNLTEDDHKKSVELIEALSLPEKVDMQWLLDSTEKFCQEKAIYNAIMSSIGILDGKDKVHTKNNIPEILTDALGISFDTHIGHDFIEDHEQRYDYYHRIEHKIPFDIELLNTITRGGLAKKTLDILLAATGAGKTLAMCHFAAANLSAGKNVLYITLEMAEEKIAERIDANLLNITTDDLAALPKDIFVNKIERLRKETTGKLIIKEYPTASAHVGHFRHLMNELHMKRNFVPDIVYIDYLNICMSSRIKTGANVNSYTYIKAIAEELRGLAVEKNVPIFSATQTTRSGSTNSDPGMEDTAESFGLPMTADLLLAMVRTEELDNQNQVMIKQLKNRYSDPTINKRFVVGINRSKMRLFDVDVGNAGYLVNDDAPVMDKSSFGMEDDNRTNNQKSKFKKFSFGV